MRAMFWRTGSLSLLGWSGSGCGGGRDLTAKSAGNLAAKPTSRGKRRNSLVTLLYLLILAACGGSQKGCPTTPCAGNCSFTTVPVPQVLDARGGNQIRAGSVEEAGGGVSGGVAAAGPKEGMGMVASM